MKFDDIVKGIAQETPQFNDYALRGLIKKDIDGAPRFIATIFEEAFKFINRGIELIGYKVLTPEERVRYELRSVLGKSTKAKIPLTVSHFQLVRYQIKYQDQYIDSHIYTPYLVDDMLMIRDKRSMVRKIILEKTFSRIKERDKDGISIKTIRVPLTFNRRHTYKAISYITGGSYTKFIVSARLFHGAIPKKICDTTIVHYMLAKFGFVKTLTKFGLKPQDVMLTETIDDDTEVFEYFAGRQFTQSASAGPGLFLKVRKTLLHDDQSLKFVVNMVYVLSFFDIQNMENAYAEQGFIWKAILGIIILADRTELKAYSNAESHLKSVDFFIDPVTRKRFENFGIVIDDIYDLLVYIFVNIDSIMVNQMVQDLYHSRIDVANGLLVKSFGENIVNSIYRLDKKSNINIQDVKKAVTFNAWMFRQVMSGRTEEDKDYVAPPELVNDNFLFAGGLNKIRLGGRAEQRIDPSMVVAESIGAFVGKTVGKTGYLNPYIPTDEHGAILHPDYAEEVDKLSPYLPK